MLYFISFDIVCKHFYGCKFILNNKDRTHVLVAILHAPIETVFYAMQGENWSPNGEARNLISNLGLSHTSMSVGDVVYVPSSNLYSMCQDIGWKPVLPK